MSTTLPTFSMRLCTKHAANRYSVDASQLSQLVVRPMLGQAYNDSADEGLVMHSPKTGNTLKFVVSSKEFDREGDLTHWVLTSCPHDMRRLKLTAPITLTIWNT